MIFNEISFEDYIPGLSRSEEVYFGINAPLSQIYLNCAKDLKEYISEDIDKNEKNYKDKKWLKGLFSLADKYADQIAKELNVEKVYFCIAASDDNMAFAEAMYYGGNYLTKKGNKTFVDFDKIAESEDIVIYPNIGYRYRNAKGKIINICVSTGCIQRLTIEQIAGTLAHETGHCFQQGIFGLYKNVADIAVTTNVKEAQSRVITLAESENKIIKLLTKLPMFKRLFKYIVVYNCYPRVLTEAIKTTYKKCVLSSLFKKQLSDPTYKMKDKLNELDNGENEDLMKDKGNDEISKFITPISSTSIDKKNEYGQNLKKDSESSFDVYEKFDLNDALQKKTKNWIVNFFRSILVDLKFTSMNRKNVLALTNYSTNQFQKISFYKKYEYFADIFATSYGFGPHIYRDYITEELRTLDFLNKLNIVGINHLPMLKALYKYSSYKAMRNSMAADVHGTNTERGRAIYTSLIKELESNPDLTENQIKSIKFDIDILKASDEYFISERTDNGGFWYKMYNKLVSESINKIDENVEEKILKPIQTVCEESIKEDHIK